MKAGSTSVKAFNAGKWKARIRLTKAPKSKPKAANGLSHVVNHGRLRLKTWHKDKNYRPFRKIHNLTTWLRKVGAR